MEKKPRNFPTLDLNKESTLTTTDQPLLVIHSPKTPTLSRKLKAVSLDSDKPSTNLEMCRDVFSMPNTPKKQIKPKLSDFSTNLIPNSNLKKFASNSSISGSQTLKTLPEIMTLQDFSDNRTTEPFRIKPKGLLERRGSNASLTIDLGSSSSIDVKSPVVRLNSAKSVSNLNLSAFGALEECTCVRFVTHKVAERRKSQEKCGNCTIYEAEPSKVVNHRVIKGVEVAKRCSYCIKSRRKSLSNENLYVPPCGFCQSGSFKECTGATKHCKGYRKAYYPRQPDLESSQLLSDDFKLHLQNVQYLQTAGNVLSVGALKQACEVTRVPKLHQEFWEVPLNLQEKCYVSGSQTRNRYKGVLPNEHSRVHLPGPQNYIHANYIKGPDYTETSYIATQGPMAHTCQDFWEMIWFTHCKCIVMLTNLVEKGRNKCELYFPLGKSHPTPYADKSFFYVKTSKVRDKFTFDPKNTQLLEEEIMSFEELNEVSYGSYTIRFVSKELLGECVIRKLELRKCKHPHATRTVYHYWFADWPDHKMANADQVLKMALHVLNLTELNRRNCDNNFNVNISKLHCCDEISGSTKKDLRAERKSSIGDVRMPIVVHCSAGIGRTGCFLAILNGIQQLKANYNVDVLAILCSLRLNRGGMVQTAEQYELIHRVLSLYADSM